MSKNTPSWRILWAVSALAFAGLARADWLATDPGTKISMQVNDNGSIVLRPVGGAWTHPLCGDVTAALLPARPTKSPHFINMLIAAAANGSFVNVFAEAEECSVQGYPLVRNIRIQGP